MDVSALGAIEQNLDKTIKILETNPMDSTPSGAGTADAPGTAGAPGTAAAGTAAEKEKKELSAQSKTSSARLLQMMVDEQSKGQMPYGGK